MSRNIKKARIARTSKVKADRSLEERVTALEKQLTDMQAAMSCDLSVANTRVLQVQSVIEANERAFAKAIKDVLAKDFATGGTLRKLLT